MDIFGKEEWKPVVRDGPVIPGYYADKRGIVVAKTGKVLSKYICPGIYGHRGKMQKLAFSTDESTFGDYNYRKPSKLIEIIAMINRKGSIPLSAALPATVAIIIGPPNSDALLFPVKISAIPSKVLIVYKPVSFRDLAIEFIKLRFL